MKSSNRSRRTPPGMQQQMFNDVEKHSRHSNMPLAARVRPEKIENIYGHDELLDESGPLSYFIRSNGNQSLILWGPPGSGKTTLANIVSSATTAHFVTLSAVTNNLADLRQEITYAKERIAAGGLRTILFIDELHRFNRSQQDGLLPHVEAGTITMIGATTENPSFHVVAPLLSRCRVFQLTSLNEEAIIQILCDAIENEMGLNNAVSVNEDALALIAVSAAGDARVALNTLEASVGIATENSDENNHDVVTKQHVEFALHDPVLRYDRKGDYHFDTISAFIKSLRFSDPDSALYWLARMLEAGEDPQFISRRLIIFASEDIGLADPSALNMAVASQQATYFVGMPEARIILAEITVYFALAKKSNSTYDAYNRALSDVEQTRNDDVPMHLRNAPTSLMKELGYSVGYKNPHSNDLNEQNSLSNRPEKIAKNKYYFQKKNDQLDSEEID
ncbi:MAG: replication-associated recombination protein A [Dehalococcoidia bacterium]|nr:replication-associated recombination protein A [Dehalococcoidia bacterium]